MLLILIQYYAVKLLVLLLHNNYFKQLSLHATYNPYITIYSQKIVESLSIKTKTFWAYNLHQLNILSHFQFLIIYLLHQLYSNLTFPSILQSGRIVCCWWDTFMLLSAIPLLYFSLLFLNILFQLLMTLLGLEYFRLHFKQDLA